MILPWELLRQILFWEVWKNVPHDSEKEYHLVLAPHVSSYRSSKTYPIKFWGMGDLFIRVLVKECQQCETLDILVARLKKIGVVLKWKNPEEEPSSKASQSKKKKKKKAAKKNASVLEPCSLSGIQNVILLNSLDLKGMK